MTGQIDKHSNRRQHQWLCAVLVLSPILLSVPAVAAAPHLVDVQHFGFEQQAQQHCPNDSIVWAVGRSGGRALIIRVPKRWYGQTSDGTYVCRKDAEAAGYRPSSAAQ